VTAHIVGGSSKYPANCSESALLLVPTMWALGVLGAEFRFSRSIAVIRSRSLFIGTLRFFLMSFLETEIVSDSLDHRRIPGTVPAHSEG